MTLYEKIKYVVTHPLALTAGFALVAIALMITKNTRYAWFFIGVAAREFFMVFRKK